MLILRKQIKKSEFMKHLNVIHVRTTAGHMAGNVSSPGILHLGRLYIAILSSYSSIGINGLNRSNIALHICDAPNNAIPTTVQ